MSKYTVELKGSQREYLEQLVKKGEAPARKMMHAHILLKTDKGPQGPRWSDRQIQEAFGVGETLPKVVRKRFVEEGLEAAVSRKRQPKRPEKQKINGEQEAQIIAVLCTQEPEGAQRWTLRALRERVIELEIVESVSYETIRTVLKKMSSSRGRKSNGVSAPRQMGITPIIWKMC